MPVDYRALRQSMRNRRRALPQAQARACAGQLAHTAARHPLLRNCRHVGAYLAVDGELDPAVLLDRLREQGKVIYLPVLIPFATGKLWFARYEPGDALVANRFGILEPACRALVRPATLDLVLTPLVAWNLDGHRIGMGGGFYDRSFAFLHTRRHWRKPVMLGVGYRFQQQHDIEANSWDVPLDAIATESGIHLATHN